MGELWLRCEDTMNCIAKNASSKFIGIFQPAVYLKQKLINRESYIPLFGENRYGSFGADWEQLIMQYHTLLKAVHEHKREYIYDFSDLFAESQLEIIQANSHLYQSGNIIFPEKVSEIIRQVYRGGEN